jgi:putative endonuclease
MTYWVYILASKPGGTLYVGVTNDLVRRIYEHREGLADGFTKRYGVKMLVYFEAHETIAAALQREKNKALVSRMENRSDRRKESSLARPL